MVIDIITLVLSVTVLFCVIRNSRDWTNMVQDLEYENTQLKHKLHMCNLRRQDIYEQLCKELKANNKEISKSDLNQMC